MSIISTATQFTKEKAYFVKNTGAQTIDVVRNGFKYLGEDVRDFPMIGAFSENLLQPEAKLHLHFHDPSTGSPPDKVDFSKVYYLYVTDSEGKQKKTIHV